MDTKKILTVPNLLILSYKLYLTVSVLGLILASFNFGYGPAIDLPKPPLNLSSIDWTGDFSESEEYKLYRTYVWETEYYASYRYDPTFYVILPCGVGTVLAGTFVVCDFFIKDLMKTTAGLYSSFGLLLTVAGFTGGYHNIYVPLNYSDFYSSYNLVVTFHSVKLILIVCQIVFSVWELCRQRVLWPTVHFSHLVTIGLVVRAGFFALNITLLIGFLLSTLNGSRSSYDDPSVRFPAYFFMPGSIACMYGVVVTFEALASHLLGHLHNRMMGITGLVMAVGYIIVTIISIPSVSSSVLLHHDKLYIALILSSVSLCVCIIYSALCLKYPRLLNTPPAIIRYLAYRMSHMKCIGESNESQDDGRCKCICINICQKISAFWKNLKASDILRTNLVLVIISFVCIVLLSLSLEHKAGCIIMLCVDVAILCRSLPALVTEVSTGAPPETQPFQIVYSFCLESTILIVGIILMYIHLVDVIQIVANVLNIIIIIFQFYNVQTNSGVKADIMAVHEIQAASTVERPADEEQPLELNNYEETKEEK